MSATIEVYRAKDGWRWRKRAANGEITADSGEAYEEKHGALNAAAAEANPDNVGVEVIEEDDEAA